MARQAERREATRGAILAAASALFGGAGFSLTSVEQIAISAGVAKGAVYHHFATKEAIFEAVFDACSAKLAKEVIAQVEGAPDVLAALAQGARVYFALCSAGANRQIILTDGPVVLGWQRWRELDSLHFGAMLPNALHRAIEVGLIEAQPVEPLAGLLLGAITEAAVACAASAAPADTAAVYVAAFARLLDGLRQPVSR
jgi:AcrR family transcriptional regulator